MARRTSAPMTVAQGLLLEHRKRASIPGTALARLGKQRSVRFGPAQANIAGKIRDAAKNSGLSSITRMT
jgi:hypothetical protein